MKTTILLAAIVAATLNSAALNATSAGDVVEDCGKISNHNADGTMCVAMIYGSFLTYYALQDGYQWCADGGTPVLTHAKRFMKCVKENPEMASQPVTVVFPFCMEKIYPCQ